MKVLVIDDIRTYEDALKLNADILHNGKHTKGKVSIDSSAEVTLIKGVSALRNLKDTEYDLIFLDHDLGDFDPDTNLPYKKPLDVVSILPMLNQKGFIRPTTIYVVHSMNPIGRKNIVEKLKAYLKEV